MSSPIRVIRAYAKWIIYRLIDYRTRRIAKKLRSEAVSTSYPVNAPLRIALLCSAWEHKNYGVVVWTRILAKRLCKDGHDVTVYAYTSGPSYEKFEDGVRVIGLPPAGYSEWPALPNVWDWLVGWQRSVCASIIRTQAQKRFDVVGGPLNPVEPLALVRAGAALPIAVSIHTTESVVLSIGGSTDGAISEILEAERELLSTAPMLISNTKAAILDVANSACVTVDSSRVKVIAHGLPDRSTKKNREKIQSTIDILYIGSIGYRKGVDILLRALERILQEIEVSAHIAGGSGDGEFIAALMNEISGAEWASRVVFHGSVSDEVKDALLASADIVVIPSRYESFGLVAVEAMMFGKPVISTTAGGIPEVVEDGVTGVLVPPSDPQALAEAMRRLIGDAELRARMGAAGRERYLAKFTDTAMADAWVAAIREGLGRLATGDHCYRARDQS